MYAEKRPTRRKVKRTARQPQTQTQQHQRSAVSPGGQAERAFVPDQPKRPQAAQGLQEQLRSALGSTDTC
eukprot:SAG31_NODE_4063_length_3625_cov_1.344016_1_plen_70_part_00